MHARHQRLKLQTFIALNLFHQPIKMAVIGPGTCHHATSFAHILINSSLSKSVLAFFPSKAYQRMGLIPVPGRLTARFSSVRDSPFLIARAATMLLRTTALFLASDGLTFLFLSPKACSIFRMACTRLLNSAGSSEAA